MPRPLPCLPRLALLSGLALAAPQACAQAVASGALVQASSPAAPPSTARTRPAVPSRPPPWALRAPAACTSRVIGGHNYFFCPAGLALDAARDYCHAFGTELAIIGSRYENDALAEVVRSLGRGRHLVGHHDRVTEGRFETVDGSPMSFSSWASGEPNNLGDEDCTELDASSIWNDIPCSGATANVLCEEAAPCTAEFFGDHLYQLCRAPPSVSPRAWCSQLGASVATIESEAEERFIAEHALSVGLDARGDTPAPSGGAVVCETASPCVRRFLDGRMFLFCMRPETTAADARRACLDLGAALAVVADARTNDFIYSNFALFRRTHFYVDLRDDDTEGSFYTRAGPALFTAWAPGKPNNLGDEDCVELGDTGWNDVPCAGDTKNAFVCELP